MNDSDQPMTKSTAQSNRLIPYKWEVLVLLWVAFCFNQADRQVYNNLLPQIQGDLQLSNEQAGLVATVFMAIYGILVPISGYAGDVLRRKWVIIGALVLWSAATLLTGLAGGIVGLIIFRGLATGAGEAFYYPSANSLIGQLPQRTRSLAMMMREMAKSYSRYGITINNVCPGATRTDINREALSDPEYEAQVIEKIPAGFIAEPENIAPAVTFLASDAARYITGASLFVDGGLCL